MCKYLIHDTKHLKNQRNALRIESNVDTNFCGAQIKQSFIDSCKHVHKGDAEKILDLAWGYVMGGGGATGVFAYCHSANIQNCPIFMESTK